MEADIISLIQNFGFPIAMVIWFMIRTEKVIGNNTKVLTAVVETIQTCKINQKIYK